MRGQDDVFQETKCHCAEGGGADNRVWSVLYRADQGVHAYYGERQEQACCAQNRGGECFYGLCLGNGVQICLKRIRHIKEREGKKREMFCVNTELLHFHFISLDWGDEVEKGCLSFAKSWVVSLGCLESF